MNTAEYLEIYKKFYRTYQNLLTTFNDDEYDIYIKSKKISDEESIVCLKMYKNSYNYLSNEILRELHNSDYFFIINFNVTLSHLLADNLINLMRETFINTHDVLFPFFDKNDSQVIKSTTNILHIKINDNKDYLVADKIGKDIIKKKRKNNQKI